MKITKDALWDAWLAAHDPHHEDPRAQKAWETEASQVFDAYFARMTARAARAALRPIRALLSGPRLAADDECTITREAVRDALKAAGEGRTVEEKKIPATEEIRDLDERLRQAVARLEARSAALLPGDALERARLSGKIEGVRLAASYLDEILRRIDLD